MRTQLLAAAALFGLVAAPMVQADDAGDIRHLMIATFDKPEAPLTVDPVTIQGDLAIAGWWQGDMGGRALLRQEDAGWELSLCAGDALKDPASLRQLGLTEAEATTLANAVVAAETELEPAIVARFASFEGIVMMGDEGSHPPVGDHAPAH